jgi:hypothetical protein
MTGLAGENFPRAKRHTGQPAVKAAASRTPKKTRDPPADTAPEALEEKEAQDHANLWTWGSAVLNLCKEVAA